MSTDTNIVFYKEPDPLERKVRLACGGVLGFLLALAVALWLGPFSTQVVVSLCLAFVGVCAYLALRYGDAFWHTALQACRASHFFQ